MDVMLGRFAERLMTEVAPKLGEGYAASSLEVIATMMTVASKEVDRAAQVRVDENRSLRELFGDAARVVADASLAQRLQQAASERDPDVLISTLDQANARLKSLLIELQEAVEASREDWARELDGRIWEVLQQAAATRAFELPEPEAS